MEALAEHLLPSVSKSIDMLTQLKQRASTLNWQPAANSTCAVRSIRSPNLSDFLKKKLLAQEMLVERAARQMHVSAWAWKGSMHGINPPEPNEGE